MEPRLSEICHLLYHARSMCQDMYDEEGRFVYIIDLMIDEFKKPESLASGYINDQVAELIGISPQALSNHKTKGTIPYKFITSTCLFLKWPINELLENDVEGFIKGIHNLEKKLIFEDDPKYDLKGIIERIKETLEWLSERLDEDGNVSDHRQSGKNKMLTLTEEFTEETIPTAYKTLMAEGFDIETALQIIFPLSKLSSRNNFSFPDPSNLPPEGGPDIPRVLENPEILFLDRYELWKFRIRMDDYIKDFTEIVKSFTPLQKMTPNFSGTYAPYPSFSSVNFYLTGLWQGTQQIEE
jgi:hypothetical protein